MKDANGMKIKSYFAKSVDEAISKARVELGSEALLLNTRKIADTGTGQGAGYEVVMGVTGPAPERASGQALANPAGTAPPAARTTTTRLKEPAPRAEMAGEMEKLRAQMDELQSLLVRSAKNSWTAQRSVPEAADVYERLLAAEVD